MSIKRFAVLIWFVFGLILLMATFWITSGYPSSRYGMCMGVVAVFLAASYPTAARIKWGNGVDSLVNIDQTLVWMPIGLVLGVVLHLSVVIAGVAFGAKYSFTNTLVVAAFLHLVGLAFFHAVAEEILFRGLLLFRIASRTGQSAAIWIQALLFALAHGLADSNSSFLTLVGVGVFLAYLTIRTKSLWLSIGVHLAWNVCVLALNGSVIHDMRTEGIRTIHTGSVPSEPILGAGLFCVLAIVSMFHLLLKAKRS